MYKVALLDYVLVQGTRTLYYVPMYIVPCTSYKVHRYIVHSRATLYDVPRTLYDVHSGATALVYAIDYDVHRTMYYVPCTMYDVPCTMYLVLCTLYIDVPMYDVRCTRYDVRCT